MCRINQREIEKGQTRNHAAVHAGKEAIQPMGVVPGFAHHHLIAGQNVNMVSVLQVLMEKHPKQLRPGQDGAKEALHRTIATTLAAHTAMPSIVTRPVIANSATMILLKWRNVVAFTKAESIVKVLQYQAWALQAAESDCVNNQLYYGPFSAGIEFFVRDCCAKAVSLRFILSCTGIIALDAAESSQPGSDYLCNPAAAPVTAPANAVLTPVG